MFSLDAHSRNVNAPEKKGFFNKKKWKFSQEFYLVAALHLLLKYFPLNMCAYFLISCILDPENLLKEIDRPITGKYI